MRCDAISGWDGVSFLLMVQDLIMILDKEKVGASPYWALSLEAPIPHSLASFADPLLD